MTCKKCNGENVTVCQDAAQTIKKAGLLWRLGRGMLVLCTMGLWLFVPKHVGHTKSRVIAICQQCGHKWRVKK